MKQVKFFLLLLLLTTLPLNSYSWGTLGHNYVVVLSMDGFRWDYCNDTLTPNLMRIATKGVKAKRFQSSFPTLTFPNHYSMATGLYPDNHGIIANRFYNKDLKKWYSPGAAGDASFYKGEPIWNTAQKHGLKTANFFWIGSEAPIGGKLPEIYKYYNQDKDITYSQRVDSVISWLSRPKEERPQLVMFYFEDPDKTTHRNDPNPAIENITRLTVAKCDSLVGVLDSKLQELPIAGNIHLIIVSDHGMCPVDESRTIYLSDYLEKSWAPDSTSSFGSPLALINIHPHKVKATLKALKKVEHINVWKRSDIPKRLHYGKNPNIGDLVILADSAWSIRKDRTPARSTSKGAHGFDNRNRDMYGIFYAYGPKFQENAVVEEFPNIQLYNIIAHLLELKNPAKTDVRLEDVNLLFKPEFRTKSYGK